MRWALPPGSVALSRLGGYLSLRARDGRFLRRSFWRLRLAG